MLIVIFIAVVLVSVLVHIPETVRCSFVLVPENGADPIQSPLMAVVQAVKVAEGQEVPAGAGPFVLRADENLAWQTRIPTSAENFRGCRKANAKPPENFTTP